MNHCIVAVVCTCMYIHVHTCTILLYGSNLFLYYGVYILVIIVECAAWTHARTHTHTRTYQTVGFRACLVALSLLHTGRRRDIHYCGLQSERSSDYHCGLSSNQRWVDNDEGSVPHGQPWLYYSTTFIHSTIIMVHQLSYCHMATVTAVRTVSLMHICILKTQSVHVRPLTCLSNAALYDKGLWKYMD